MRPLLFLLFLVSLASSCQQRYGHVKKIRTPSKPTEATAPDRTVFVGDEATLNSVNSYTALNESRWPENDTMMADLTSVSVESGADALSFGDRISFEETKSDRSIPNAVVLKKEVTKDEPPNELLLMIAVFLAWLIPLLLVSAGILLVLYGATLVGLLSFGAFALISIILTLGTSLLGFYIGRRRIKGKYRDEPKKSKIVGAYFIAFGICILLFALILLVGAFVPGVYYAYAFIPMGLVFLVSAIYAVLFRKSSPGA